MLIFSTGSVKCVGCFSPAGRIVRTLRAVWRKYSNINFQDCFLLISIADNKYKYYNIKQFYNKWFNAANGSEWQRIL